jgi:hypothetical protein
MGLQVITIHEKLSTTMKRFGQDIEQLERQKLLFSSSPAMQAALGEWYGTLFEFCVGAASFIKKHTIG